MLRELRNITEEDFEYAKRLGYTMKLIGIADLEKEKVDVSVHPTLLPNDHPLVFSS